jgi:hypothetical protein
VLASPSAFQSYRRLEHGGDRHQSSGVAVDCVLGWFGLISLVKMATRADLSMTISSVGLFRHNRGSSRQNGDLVPAGEQVAVEPPSVPFLRYAVLDAFAAGA